MRPRGQTLLLAILVVATLTSLGLTAIVSVLANRTVVRSAKERALARNIAEAGIEKALYEINKSTSFPGDPATAFGGGYFKTTVTAVGNNKQIDSVGYYPTEANFRVRRTLRILGTISTSRVAFNYGVQIGQGGFVMDNNSVITGNVYANGNVVGNPGSGTKIDGDAVIAAGANVDETFTNYQSDQNVGDVASQVAAAESFKPGSTEKITQVALYLRKVGNPSQNLTVRIHADNAGSPDSTALASGTLIASQATSSYTWVTVPLSSPIPLPTLTQNTTYWVSLDAGSASSTDFWQWGKDNNLGYGNGVGKIGTAWNGTWSAVIAGDLNFKTYLAGSANKIQDVQEITGNAKANIITHPGGGTYSITKDAYYASTFTGYTAAATYPGSPDQSIQPLPLSEGDILDWKNAAATNLYTGVCPYHVTGNQNLGPIKIPCDLNVDHGLTLTLQGYVWVTGNVHFDNGTSTSSVRLDQSFGNASSVLVADGSIYMGTKWEATGSGQGTCSNNSAISCTTDAQCGGSNKCIIPSYLMVLSTYASSTTNAIDIWNSSSGGIFYATAGTININNNVKLKEVTGYKVHLNQGATITYESGLANAQFTTGPGASWGLLKDSWQELKP